MTREAYVSDLKSVALDIYTHADEIIGNIDLVKEINIAIKITPDETPSYTTTRCKFVLS